MEQAQKDSLKVQALTQRIAQVVAQYENELADVRAEATIIIEDLQDRLKNLETVSEDSVEATEPADTSDTTK